MTEDRERAFRLENDARLPIRCDLRLPAGDGPFPVVVILHGFKGFKDWGMFPPTARELTDRGFATVTMNTSMNGVEDELTEFTDLDAFSRNTPRREVRDVQRVLDAIESGEIEPALDASRIGLLGHSRGGGVVLLTAGGDARAKCVVTWASIASFWRHTARAREEWRRRGRLDIPNARTGQMMWLSSEVLEDAEANREEYDIVAACGRITAPVLAVHGALDEAVDASDCARIVDAAAAPAKRALVIPKTGHTFGAQHPWAGPTEAWREVVGATGDWFVEHLKAGGDGAR